MTAALALKPEAEKLETFAFDAAFQSKIAVFAVRDNVFARRCDGLIEPHHFDLATEGLLAGIAAEYFRKFRALPASKSVWGELVKDAVATKRIRKEMMPEVVDKLKELLAGSLSDRDYVIEKVATFARHQAVQRAHLESIDLIEKGEYDRAQEVMERAFRVGASDEFEDVNYWDEEQIEARSKYREDVAAGKIPKRGIPSGIKKLDYVLYHGGWGRGELSTFMAKAKAGKSCGLGYFAGRASLQGFNAIYFTLEVSTNIIADRTDACLSDTEMKNLGTTGKAVSDRLKVYRSGERKPGELRLVGFPSGTLTCRQIRRVLERYKADGIKFDLIVIDYADIMAPDHWVDNAQENSKQIWLGLRAIGQEEDAAVLTATQTNREGAKEATAKDIHAAEDYNKIRIADLVISINHTDEERAAGQARLFFAASRNQQGEFTLNIKQDMAKMKFITAVTGVA